MSISIMWSLKHVLALMGQNMQLATAEGTYLLYNIKHQPDGL